MQAQFNDLAISVTNAEVVLDSAINLLNGFDAELDNLGGDAGSKSGTYTSKQTGAIMAVALQIYRENFKHAEGDSGQIGALGQTFSISNQLLSFARQMANQLKSGAIYRT